MESFLNFLGDHYILFIIIAVVLILALIGYFADKASVQVEKPKTISLDSQNKPIEATNNQPVSDKTETLDL